jgi:hypothetical protein
MDSVSLMANVCVELHFNYEVIVVFVVFIIVLL